MLIGLQLFVTTSELPNFRSLFVCLFVWLVGWLVCLFVCLFVLFCFVLFCFVLFCFVLFCFVLFCFVLFCLFVFSSKGWSQGGKLAKKTNNTSASVFGWSLQTIEWKKHCHLLITEFAAFIYR